MLTKAKPIIGHYLYESDFYQIKDWAFDSTKEIQPKNGYNDCFCVVYVKKGYYFFDQVKPTDMHSGHVLLEKANFDYSLRSAKGACTIFNFTDDFYQQFIEDLQLNKAFFFSNPNLISLVVQSTPEIEYLHHLILKNIGFAGKLELDNLVLDFLDKIISVITNEVMPFDLSAANLRFHLTTIEQAKSYIHENFSTDISLYELSRSCCVSPFHFSRLFKKITNYAPNQYLQTVRLAHSEILLKTTKKPVAEIAFTCGFSSPEYFATAFKQKWNMNPSVFRTK